MSEFNELFNEYFGDNEDKNNKDGFDKIMDLMSKLNSGGGLDGLNPEETFLGEPTNIREFERDGTIFEESTWDTPQGTIVRISTKEDIEFSPDFFKNNNIPFGNSFNDREEIPLEDRLKIEIEEENYEEAAKIRDLINEKEKKIKTSETPNNKGINTDDGWNF